MRFEVADYTTYNEARDMGGIMAAEELERIMASEPAGDYTDELRESSIRNLSKALDDLASLQARADAHAEQIAALVG